MDVKINREQKDVQIKEERLMRKYTKTQQKHRNKEKEDTYKNKGRENKRRMYRHK